MAKNLWGMILMLGTACSGGSFNGATELGSEVSNSTFDSTPQGIPDATPPLGDSGGDALVRSDALEPDVQETNSQDAAAEVGSVLDAGIACSCAVLCSPGHSLRVCESCRTDTCPGWDGGWPE